MGIIFYNTLWHLNSKVEVNKIFYVYFRIFYFMLLNVHFQSKMLQNLYVEYADDYELLTISPILWPLDE